MFLKPKTELEKCKRWIKNCGRPHEQLNLERVIKHKALCSSVGKLFCLFLDTAFSTIEINYLEFMPYLQQHFVGKNGPTEKWPDPVPADGSPPVPARKLPAKRRHASLPSDCPPKQFRVNNTCPTSVEEGQVEASVSLLM